PDARDATVLDGHGRARLDAPRVGRLARNDFRRAHEELWSHHVLLSPHRPPRRHLQALHYTPSIAYTPTLPPHQLSLISAPPSRSPPKSIGPTAIAPPRSARTARAFMRSTPATASLTDRPARAARSPEYRQPARDPSASAARATARCRARRQRPCPALAASGI